MSYGLNTFRIFCASTFVGITAMTVSWLWDEINVIIIDFGRWELVMHIFADDRIMLGILKHVRQNNWKAALI